jgi:PBSX family phage terminase large subunit
MSNFNQLTFEPLGGNRDLLLAKEPEILAEGPAGTGKSRAILEKLYILAGKYPGSRLAMVRKTRKSITQSVQVTWEDKVLPPDWRNYIQWHGQKQEYRFPRIQGRQSRVIVLGMNDKERIKSTEFDVIFVNEGTELSVDDYELLLSRMRNGTVPYQQMLIDTNPGAPHHWLNKRASSDAMRRIKTTHEDNPAVTPEYLALLDQLTGVRYKRLRMGVWVAAEGMVYDEWDRDTMVIPPRRLPPNTHRYITVDFGWSNAFVAQWWAHDRQNDTVTMYREIYHGQRRVEQHAHQMYKLSARENIEAIITDWDAEDRETIAAHWHEEQFCGWEAESSPPPLLKANKDIESGIQAVKQRLATSRILFYEDATVEIDPSLKERGRPTSTVEEFDSYEWDVRQSNILGEIHKEVPKKKDDHGMDAMRYFVRFLDNEVHKAQSRLLAGTARMSVNSKPAPVEIDQFDALTILLSQR